MKQPDILRRCPFCDTEVKEFFSRGRCFECYLNLVAASATDDCPDFELIRLFYMDIGGESGS